MLIVHTEDAFQEWDSVDDSASETDGVIGWRAVPVHRGGVSLSLRDAGKSAGTAPTVSVTTFGNRFESASIIQSYGENLSSRAECARYERGHCCHT
jgi:hypothetical protein